MSLQFNDTTNNLGLIQLIERNCKLEGKISSNTNLLKNFTADVNVAFDKLLMILFSSSGKWQFDDSNHTDYPIITTNLVAGQRDYSFTTDEQGNIILDIYAPSIRDFAVLMNQCAVLVSNEGGTVHIAKALNKPTFTIFSPYINKDDWSSFEDGKIHKSVHLLDFIPNAISDLSYEQNKEIEKNPRELYLKLTPEMIISELQSFLEDYL